MGHASKLFLLRDLCNLIMIEPYFERVSKGDN